MSDQQDGKVEQVFKVFTGTPDTVVDRVNHALTEYSVVAWNWSVCNNHPVLSALMVSHSEIRRAQLASIQPSINQGRH